MEFGPDSLIRVLFLDRPRYRLALRARHVTPPEQSKIFLEYLLIPVSFVSKSLL